MPQPQMNMPAPQQHQMGGQQNMPQQNMMQQMPVNFTPNSDPVAAEFYSKTMPIYAAISEINPTYKQLVGQHIFEFVTKLVGAQMAPKITGMLIDLPIPEIQRYVTDWGLFGQRVTQAQELLNRQQAQPAPAQP